MYLKTIFVIASAIAVSILTSCKNDNDIQVNLPKDRIRIRVGMPEHSPDSKSRVAYEDLSLKLTWEEGDQIRMVGYNGLGGRLGVTDLQLKSAPGESSADFEGDAVDGAVKYKIYYPITSVNDKGKEFDKKKTFSDYAGQVQTGDNNTDHLKKYISLKYLDDQNKDFFLVTDKDPDSYYIKLTMLNSIIRFDLKNIPHYYQEESNEITGLKWSIINKREKVEKELSLGLQDMILGSSQNSMTAYLCFEDMDVPRNDGIKVTLEGNIPQGAAEFKKTEMLEGKEYLPNHRYVALVDFTEDVSIKRLTYTNSFEFKPSMFTIISDSSLQPLGGSYDPVSQSGYIDFPIKISTNDIEFSNLDGVNKSTITSVTIPVGINRLAYDLFKGTEKLKELIIAGTSKTPKVAIGGKGDPMDKKDPLGISQNKDLKIYVPDGTAFKYRVADSWSNYNKMIVRQKDEK